MPDAEKVFNAIARILTAREDGVKVEVKSIRRVKKDKPAVAVKGD